LFHQVGRETDQWAQLAAAVLAHASQMGALATPLRSDRCRFKHIELVEVRNGLALLVLVLHQGIVKQQMLNVDYRVGQDALSQISNQLNDVLAGLTTGEIDARRLALSELGQQVASVIQDVMTREDNPGNEQIYREGLSHMLMQPEFSLAEDAHQLVAVLEQPPLLASIFENVRQRDGVQILIGGDGRLRAAALVEPGPVALRHCPMAPPACWASSARCACSTAAQSRWCAMCRRCSATWSSSGTAQVS
jgi:heat-inducible transcriptional repressor